MRVIGAGLGGTGTLQTGAALEVLGFGPCYHVAEVAKHPHHPSLWRAVAEGQTIDWDTILGGYESSVDFPGSVLYARMMAAYPEASVLLTVREPARAYARVRETIYRLSRGPDSPLPPDLRHAFDALVWDGTFGGAFEDEAHAIGVFERWPEEVRARVPGDRLLEYDVDDGWEPLCRFLDVAVPATPFPA